MDKLMKSATERNKVLLQAIIWMNLENSTADKKLDTTAIYNRVSPFTQKERHMEGQQDSSGVKELTLQPDNLGLISGMHTVEGENTLLCCSPTSTCMLWCVNPHMHTRIHTLKIIKETYFRDKSIGQIGVFQMTKDERK